MLASGILGCFTLLFLPYERRYPAHLFFFVSFSLFVLVGAGMHGDTTFGSSEVVVHDVMKADWKLNLPLEIAYAGFNAVAFVQSFLADRADAVAKRKDS